MALWQKVKKAVLEKVEDGFNWVDNYPSRGQYLIECQLPSVAYFIMGVIMDVVNEEEALNLDLHLKIYEDGVSYINLKL
jgi:hypothetical protein